MDINVVGAITGSVFAVAAIVPFIVSALRTSLKKRRAADSQSADVTRRWLIQRVEWSYPHFDTAWSPACALCRVEGASRNRSLTHLAIGLGVKAAHTGYSMLFDTANNWIISLAAARQAGQLEAELRKIRRASQLSTRASSR